MLTRVTWGKIKPGQWDKYEKLWNEHAKNTAGVKGLRARYLLRDTETSDAGYTLSIWESQEDFEAYSKNRPPATEMEQCFVGQYVTNVCDLRGATPPI